MPPGTGQYEPSVHDVHDGEPDDGAYFPDEHSVQLLNLVDRGREVLPAAHAPTVVVLLQ